MRVRRQAGGRVRPAIVRVHPRYQHLYPVVPRVEHAHAKRLSRSAEWGACLDDGEVAVLGGARKRRLPVHRLHPSRQPRPSTATLRRSQDSLELKIGTRTAMVGSARWRSNASTASCEPRAACRQDSHIQKLHHLEKPNCRCHNSFTQSFISY